MLLLKESTGTSGTTSIHLNANLLYNQLTRLTRRTPDQTTLPLQHGEFFSIQTKVGKMFRILSYLTQSMRNWSSQSLSSGLMNYIISMSLMLSWWKQKRQDYPLFRSYELLESLLQIILRAVVRINSLVLTPFLTFLRVVWYGILRLVGQSKS